MEKPSIPKGTRDFSPTEMVRRNYIFDTVKSVYQRYGYLPIETPAMENIETLTGKYGEEGDRLIFKILNSGDFYQPIHKIITELIAQTSCPKEEDESVIDRPTKKYLAEYIEYLGKLISLYKTEIS